MRTLALVIALAAVPALAQVRGFVAIGAPAGSWGGYVGGWQQPGASTGTWTGYVGGWKSNAVVGPVAPRVPGYRPIVAVPVWVAPAPAPQATETSDAAQQRAWAEAQAQAEREANERRLAEERQRTAEERQRAAEERERLAVERQRAAEQQLVAEQALAAQRALIDAQQAELRRLVAPPPVPATPPKDETPGNEVYRWVDDDGVTHFSTRVPEAMKARARPVGARSR